MIYKYQRCVITEEISFFHIFSFEGKSLKNRRLPNLCCMSFYSMPIFVFKRCSFLEIFFYFLFLSIFIRHFWYTWIAYLIVSTNCFLKNTCFNKVFNILVAFFFSRTTNTFAVKCIASFWFVECIWLLKWMETRKQVFRKIQYLNHSLSVVFFFFW